MKSMVIHLMKQSKYLGFVFGLVLLAARCQPVVSALTASQPLIIDCHITSQLTAPREGQSETEAATVSLSLDGESEMVAFESFEFHAQFVDEPVKGRILTISILNPDSGVPLQNQEFLLQRATHKISSAKGMGLQVYPIPIMMIQLENLPTFVKPIEKLATNNFDIDFSGFHCQRESLSNVFTISKVPGAKV